MPFGPDRSELVPLSFRPQPRRPGLLQLLVALGRPAAAAVAAAAAAAPGAVATFLVCAAPPSGSCPVPGWLFLGRPAPLLLWPCRPCLLPLLAALGQPAAAPAAAAAAAAAPAAATFSSACAADVTVLHHSFWAGPSGAAGAAVPHHSLWAGHPAPPAPLLPWLCQSCLLPLLDPSHLRDDRLAESCRPQPGLPWAQWPMAFLCPSLPYFLPSACAYHTTVVLLLPNVNTGLVSAQSRRTNALANCLFSRGGLSHRSLCRPGNYSGPSG
jgi:hypothetical protein